MLCILTGASLSLHGSELQHQSLRRHRVQLQPSASGYRAADRPLAFPSCGEEDIMEESLATAPDSSTQDDVPPLGEHHQQQLHLCRLHSAYFLPASLADSIVVFLMNTFTSANKRPSLFRETFSDLRAGCWHFQLPYLESFPYT